MVRQTDFKRLLAYSSVEHMGILVFGIGIGGLAAKFALFHLAANALVKSVLFLSAGNIHRSYASKQLPFVRAPSGARPCPAGSSSSASWPSPASPPFAPFISEFNIAARRSSTGHILGGTAFLILLGGIFLAMSETVVQVVFGTPSAQRVRTPYKDARPPRRPYRGPGAGPGPGDLDAPPAPGDARSRCHLGRRCLSAGGGAAMSADLPILPQRPEPAPAGGAGAAHRCVPGRHPAARPGRGPPRLPLRGSCDLRLYAVLADDAGHVLRVLRAKLDAPRYPALTPDCPQAHLFEREIAEQSGIVPEGHPWLKPVRFHLPWNGAPDPWKRDGAPAPGRGGLLPRGGRGGPRGGRGAGPCGRHRARPLPLPVPRRAGLPSGDRPGLPASGRGEGPGGRSPSPQPQAGGDGLPGTAASPTPGPTAACWRAWRTSRCLPGWSWCGVWPWSWSASPTMWATSAPCRAMWASCPRPPSAGASAGTG